VAEQPPRPPSLSPLQLFFFRHQQPIPAEPPRPTSPRTRSLRPIRVSSNQNTRWWSISHFPLIKDKESLSLYISYFPYIFDEVEYLSATLHTCDKNNRVKCLVQGQIDVDVLM
jgi:hypothetical protein